MSRRWNFFLPRNGLARGATRAWERFRAASALRYDQTVEETLGALAEHCEGHLDLEGLLELSA